MQHTKPDTCQEVRDIFRLNHHYCVWHLSIADAAARKSAVNSSTLLRIYREWLLLLSWVLSDRYMLSSTNLRVPWQD